MMVSNRDLLFQGSIFRCYVSFREGKDRLDRSNCHFWNFGYVGAFLYDGFFPCSKPSSNDSACVCKMLPHCLESTQQGDHLTKLTKLPSLECHQQSHVNLLRSNSISRFTSIHPRSLTAPPSKMMVGRRSGFLLGWLIFRAYLNLSCLFLPFFYREKSPKMGPENWRRRHREGEGHRRWREKAEVRMMVFFSRNGSVVRNSRWWQVHRNLRDT